jgi:hypothetical protein
MAAALKKGKSPKAAKSNAPVIGGAGGIGVAAFATQIQDPGYRNLLTVAAPVIAVMLSSIFDATVVMVRNAYQSAIQRWHEQKTTNYAKKLLNDPDSSEEVKARAARAIANAQLATIEYHEKNLTLVSQVAFSEASKQNRGRAARSKNNQPAK